MQNLGTFGLQAEEEVSLLACLHQQAKPSSFMNLDNTFHVILETLLS